MSACQEVGVSPRICVVSMFWWCARGHWERGVNGAVGKRGRLPGGTEGGSSSWQRPDQ